MAIGFDESNDYYTIGDAAELTLPDGDWCVGVWSYVADNAGSLYQYLLSNGNYGANGSFNLFLCEAGEGGTPNRWYVWTVDDDGTAKGFVSSAPGPGADSTWRLIVAQRSTGDSELQMWFCTPGGAASKVASTADAGFNAVNGGVWNVGRRVDGNVDRYYGSLAAEVFKGDFKLSQAEIEALAAGLPILTLAAQKAVTLDLYLPMWQADATLVDYSGSGNDATRQDAPTSEMHPPICTPTKRRRF